MSTPDELISLEQLLPALVGGADEVCLERTGKRTRLVIIAYPVGESPCRACIASNLGLADLGSLRELVDRTLAAAAGCERELRHVCAAGHA